MAFMRLQIFKTPNYRCKDRKWGIPLLGQKGFIWCTDLNPKEIIFNISHPSGALFDGGVFVYSIEVFMWIFSWMDKI